MPLNSTSLHDDLLDLFEDPGATIAACADAWGSAMEGCCSGIVPPSTTVSAAAGVLKTQLAAAFALSYPASVASIELAFTAFGTAVGLGMLPAYAATPPAGPVGFSDLVGTTRDTYEEAATDTTSLLMTFLGTGTATLVAPPNTVLPWS